MLSLRRFTDTDFPLLLTWLAKPHVKEWWDDGDDTLEKVARHYHDQSPTNERFILLYHAEPSRSSGQPIGYMQYEVDEENVASIDQFIGEADMLNRGFGTAAIKLLLEHIETRHQPHFVTVDPSPANHRAIRCYEKVGFQHDATLSAPASQEAYMMKIKYKPFT